MAIKKRPQLRTFFYSRVKSIFHMTCTYRVHDARFFLMHPIGTINALQVNDHAG